MAKLFDFHYKPASRMFDGEAPVKYKNINKKLYNRIL